MTDLDKIATAAALLSQASDTLREVSTGIGLVDKSLGDSATACTDQSAALRGLYSELVKVKAALETSARL